MADKLTAVETIVEFQRRLHELVLPTDFSDLYKAAITHLERLASLESAPGAPSGAAPVEGELKGWLGYLGGKVDVAVANDMQEDGRLLSGVMIYLHNLARENARLKEIAEDNFDSYEAQKVKVERLKVKNSTPWCCPNGCAYSLAPLNIKTNVLTGEVSIRCNVCGARWGVSMSPENVEAAAGHVCTCKDVGMGTYENTMIVPGPKHMKRSCYALDRCIAEEVMLLWIYGVETTGSCCGHGEAGGYIGVTDEFIPFMLTLGYETRVNETDSTRKDSFKPMGVLGLRDKSIRAGCPRIF